MPSKFHPLLAWFRKARPASARVRPQLLALEDRSVPTTVNTLADVVDAADGKTSLREAVAAFNADPDDPMGTNTISFDAALGKGPTFTLTLGELAVTGKAGATNTLLSLTNSEPTEIVISGNNASRLFNISADAGLGVSGLFNLTGGKADKGGAVFSAGNLSLSNARVTGNQAQAGGGLYVDTSGSLTLANSTLADNRATAGNGGGILDNGSKGVVITNSLISGNGAAGDGGGLLGGNVTLVNTTVSGNSAAGDGGGTWSNGQLVAVNSTIVLNRADFDNDGNGKGGGVFIAAGGTALLSNTLIGGNLVGTGTTAGDIEGDLTGAGSVAKNNLIADPGSAGGLTDGTNGNVVGAGGAAIAITSIINPTLAANGGIGPANHALVAGGAAVDKGDKTLAVTPGTGNPITSDSRGNWVANVGKSVARVAGAEADIGAFELQNAPPQVTGPKNTIALVEDGPGVSFTGANTITVTDDAFAAPNYVLVLTVADGKLTLGTTAGLSGLTGNGSKEVKFNAATLASLNGALGSLSFAAAANQYGGVAVTVNVDDGETTAPGGAQLGFATAVSIEIAPVTDAPTVTNATTGKNQAATVTFTRNAVDGTEVSYFKVTNVKNIASLTYDSDGLGKVVTIVAGTAYPFAGDYGFAFGPDSLTKFTVTPAAGFEGVASFDIQAGIGTWPGTAPGSQPPVFGGPVVTSTVTVGNPPADKTAPTATLGTAPAVGDSSNKTQYDFTVTFGDNVAVSFASIDGKDVRVMGPNGFSQLATLVSVDKVGDGTPRTATYRITAPGGAWDTADNGKYSIALEAGQVADTAGNTAAAATLGTFTATLTGPAAPPSPTRVGYQQFAVGADRGGIGTVHFFNPDKSTRLVDPLTPFGTFTGGVRVAAGDVNGDGVADIVVGTGPGRPTQVKVIDGATLAELFSVDPFEAAFTGGVYVVVGDLNGDGFADIVITPDEGGGPRARVFSGKGFSQMADFFGIEDVNFRGGARAAIGDITGDGKADLVVAAGFGGGPRVGVFDGAKLAAEGNLPDNQTFSRWNTWKPFGDFLAFEPALRNGTFVAVGDLDGDGFSELIAGGGPGGGPRVTAFSGKQLLDNAQTAIINFFAGDVNNRGGVRVAVKNLDNDAKADLVAGSGTGGGSRVTAYLGANILAAAAPTPSFDFDAIAGFTGGVFVG